MVPATRRRTRRRRNQRLQQQELKLEEEWMVVLCVVRVLVNNIQATPRAKQSRQGRDKYSRHTTTRSGVTPRLYGVGGMVRMALCRRLSKEKTRSNCTRHETITICIDQTKSKKTKDTIVFHWSVRPSARQRSRESRLRSEQTDRRYSAHRSHSYSL